MPHSAHLLLALLLAGAMSPLFCACAAPSPQTGLVDNRLRPCPDSPNCVNSDALSGQARIEPLAYKGSPERAWQNLKEAIGETGGKIVDENSGYLWVVYTSAIMRFKDDVEFRLDQSVQAIQVRSASRVGYWDLGANRRRVEQIRKRFSELSLKSNLE